MVVMVMMVVVVMVVVVVVVMVAVLVAAAGQVLAVPIKQRAKKCETRDGQLASEQNAGRGQSSRKWRYGKLRVKITLLEYISR